MFHKDDRNLRGNGSAKKRMNLKEVKRRMDQIQKRNTNKMEKQKESDPEAEEWVEPKSKYDNGKPPKVQKVQ